MNIDSSAKKVWIKEYIKNVLQNDNDVKISDTVLTDIAEKIIYHFSEPLFIPVTNFEVLKIHIEDNLYPDPETLKDKNGSLGNHVSI